MKHISEIIPEAVNHINKIYCKSCKDWLDKEKFKKTNLSTCVECCNKRGRDSRSEKKKFREMYSGF